MNKKGFTLIELLAVIIIIGIISGIAIGGTTIYMEKTRDKSSNLFLFLTKIQDEVHRYAITYHRNIKSKGALSSLLDVIPGIGEQRKKDLLRKFGSLKKMKEATLEELKEVLPEEVASNVYTYLKEI